MEYKFMQNPQIINFLNQYSKKEWDSIIEDLLLYSINKVNEIEKEQIPEKEEKIPQKVINKNPDIISFNCNNTNPYECATNLLKQNAEFKSKSGLNNNTLKKLDELNSKFNDIQLGEKNKNIKKKKKNKI